ncbi:MAG TPA: sigma 54-interacting transcriptional regulator [Candidatus Binatia bacterium]
MNVMPIEVNAEHTSDEVKRLQGCINDLFGVLAPPALWNDHESPELMSTFLDVLVEILRLDFAYARASDTIEGVPIEVLRAARRISETSAHEVSRALQGWLTGDLPTMPFQAPNPIGEGNISIVPFRLGLLDEAGVLLAASRRADFPTEMERMLLQVAANQAVIALRETQILGDHKRVTDRLERWVNERTAQLTAINEDLRKEIIERKAAEEALKTNEERFRLLIEGVKDYAIYMLDVDGRVMTWNNGAERIKGYHTEEILGKHFSVFYQPQDILADRPAQALRVAKAEGRFEQEGWCLRKDGSRFWANGVITALKDRSGRLQGFAKVTRDISERKQAEEKLRRSEAYLAEGQRLSRTGSWAWDVSSGDLYWSQEYFRIFGLDPEKAKMSYEMFLEIVHPEDRSALKQRFEQAVREKSDFANSFRIVWPDGSTKHIHSLSHPVLNESGDVIEYVGTVIDRTEQHEARAKLEQAFEEIKMLKDRLQHENIALREEIDRTGMFEEIVGSSPALKSVVSRIAKVASTDSTVLISGETGTGKELIARAIHKRSKRASGPFVAFNCASVPPTLIASELFGHEKGAFTGAQLRRLGRFELAEGGTIFLDEVGDLPAETQIALLRVIQEREFERVGGSHPISTNARIIAATNRNLEDAIVAGTFRLDLFYRLNVFPIELPSLRERKADIPALVEYFIKRHATDAGKRIRMVDKKTAELFQSYAWPGNIRELQSVIERSVILCEGEILSVDPSWLSVASAKLSRRSCSLAERLQEEEKNCIESALAESKGKISGDFGAAAKLGIPSSTLESKIKTLKIQKYHFKSN